MRANGRQPIALIDVQQSMLQQQHTSVRYAEEQDTATDLHLDDMRRREKRRWIWHLTTRQRLKQTCTLIAFLRQLLKTITAHDTYYIGHNFVTSAAQFTHDRLSFQRLHIECICLSWHNDECHNRLKQYRNNVERKKIKISGIKNEKKTHHLTVVALHHAVETCQ